MSIRKYYQPEIETMSVEEIKKLQSEKLVKQVKHVYDNVEAYRKKMDEKGVKPEDIYTVAICAYGKLFAHTEAAGFTEFHIVLLN